MKQITKDEFISKYKKMSISELAKELNTTRATIYNYVIKYNLPPKRKTLIKK